MQNSIKDANLLLNKEKNNLHVSIKTIGGYVKM